MFVQLDSLYAEIRVPILSGSCPFGLSVNFHLKDGFVRVLLSTPVLSVSVGRRPSLLLESGREHKTK